MKAHKYFLSFEKKAHELTINNYYQNCHADFYKLIISNIMWNAKRHIVSLFKDYLIFDELAEFFIAFYPFKKSYKKLNELFNYYEESSFIFPNYTPLPESKYIYRSIIKKQRVIDEQENLEELKIKQKKFGQKQKNIFYDFYHDSGSESKFFNSNVYNSILKPSESLIKILFGLDNKRKKDIDYLNKNFINSSNSINSDNEESYIGNYYIDENEDLYLNDKIEGNKDYYDEDIDDIKNIIKNIYQIEKKKNTFITVKDIFKNDQNNNSSKIKIKLGLLPNNENNNNNNFYIVNRTGIGKIQRNILNGIRKNNFFKKYDSGNNSRINQNKVNLYLLKNNKNFNNISIKNRTKTKYDLQENMINSEISNPLVITNYTLKNNNNSNIKTTINSIPKKKKVRSTYFFNDSSINNINNNHNHNNSNNKNSLIKLKNNNFPNDNNYNLYRNEYNTPTQKRTKTLDRNMNKINIKSNNNNNNINNNQKNNNDSIININININETNLFVNNTNKNNFYKKNDYYPKIIPKLDFNSMVKMNNTYKQSLSKDKEKHSNSIKNKNYKNTLCLNDLKNIYKNNNFTERNLINNKETSGKRIGKINEKFKLMLGLPTSNKKIQFRKKQNETDRNYLYFTESNHTLKINNINNTNNHFNIKNLQNNTIKYNNSIDKNKVVLTESLTKIKI